MKLSPRYWLRRWLTPELELGPRALAEREAKRLADEAECAAICDEIFGANRTDDALLIGAQTRH